MEQIRVELTPRVGERNRYDLLVMRGENDITVDIAATQLIALRAYIPAAHRGFISISRQRYQNLGWLLSRYEQLAVPPAVLADAIRAYVAELPNDLSIVSETEDQEEVVKQLAAAEPSFLTIGGRMFRLQATEHSDAGLKLLKKAREQAAAAVRAHRDAAIARTNAECAVQRRQLDTERQQLADERAEFARGGRCVIPDWLRSKVLIGGTEGWLLVKQSFSYHVTKFVVPEHRLPRTVAERAAGALEGRLVALEWDALRPTAPPVTINYWLKVNPTLGTYDVAHSYLDQSGPQLPHAGHSGFCVQPDGMPPRCTRFDDIVTITNNIARAFRTVNLSSLLHRVTNERPTSPYCPPGVAEYLGGVYENVANIRGIRVVERDTPRQIWEAQNLPPAPPPEAGTTAAAWAEAAGNTETVVVPQQYLHRVAELRHRGGMTLAEAIHQARMERAGDTPVMELPDELDLEPDEALEENRD